MSGYWCQARHGLVLVVPCCLVVGNVMPSLVFRIIRENILLHFHRYGRKVFHDTGEVEWVDTRLLL